MLLKTTAPAHFRSAAPVRATKMTLLALAASCAFAATAAAEALNAPLQKSDVEKIIRDYLTANPEVVRTALELAEVKKRENAISQAGDKLLNSPRQAVIGNPSGDVTLVEFYDYNCGYCKQSVANVAKLMESDPNLRVVLKDFPILSTESIEAAQVATALREQFKGAKYFEFHRKLMGFKGGRIGKTQALATAKELGADMDKLEADLKSPEIQESLKEAAELADKLGFEGTPSWVVGKESIVGGLPYAQLKTKIDNVRKCGKTAC